MNFLFFRIFHVRRLGYDGGRRFSSEEENDKYLEQSKHQQSIKSNNHKHPYAIPGVFNCRFSNPVSATTRKKKKPTSFVPPPTQQDRNPGSRAMSVPFWKKALPKVQDESHTNNEPRINIQQKLQEKKQKQLAELKLIEEEIKLGKLNGPTALFSDLTDTRNTSLPKEPIPTNKRLGEMPNVGWRAHNSIVCNDRHTPNCIYTQQEANVSNTYLHCNESGQKTSQPSNSSNGKSPEHSNQHSIELKKMSQSGFVVYKNGKYYNPYGASSKAASSNLNAARIQDSGITNIQKRILRMKTQTPEILLTPNTNFSVYYNAMNNDGQFNHVTNHSKYTPSTNNEEIEDDDRDNAQGQFSDIDSQVR